MSVKSSAFQPRASHLRRGRTIPRRVPQEQRRAARPCPQESLSDLGLGCWGEADAALAELGRLDHELATLEAQRQEEERSLERRVEAAVRPLAARRAALLAALERFCRRQAPELARVKGRARRSRRLLFGRVGYRTSEAVSVARESAALRALARWRKGRRFLRVRRELDREALRRFLHPGRANGGDRTRLRRAGIQLERRQSWFYEIDAEALRRWAS